MAAIGDDIAIRPSSGASSSTYSQLVIASRVLRTIPTSVTG